MATTEPRYIYVGDTLRLKVEWASVTCEELVEVEDFVTGDTRKVWSTDYGQKALREVVRQLGLKVEGERG